ncbi:hypothetical protein LEMA_P067120.1 [Plenodomus lingam JN3]|uniref:Mitotic apparatus protein p62 n=1 Tax=Leptosphaeria maculans (strain JN3 / isolate v23.1.3 / race Av1-4-5-6-7-8) TaxID=985895 RepID=E4ZH16_LEPMJ|nr:hypothetical protein LEMA_P067120.1 [Plenodomus lingam JN3]CBX90586.1 hypothetical protein LEMA_P067120.1 [Plenodomus lingam JN3]
MAVRCIVQVEPASGQGQTVVVEVRQEGKHPLDVRLVGCEGESPYVTTIQQRNLGKLKQKFKGSDDEWLTLLSYFLLQTPPREEQIQILAGVRLVYVLNSGSLELSIRQDIGDIKVTLGEITLPLDEEYEINPFEWAQTSAVAHAETLRQVADLTTRVNSEKSTMAKLDAQLQDFIRNKTEAETAMLQQFMRLLNEKKRKIRDQGRLLAEAQVDLETASTVKASRAATKSRKPVASRSSKRKAPLQATEVDQMRESDSDQMEIDKAKTGEQEGEEAPAVRTPERNSSVTDTEEEEEEEEEGKGNSARMGTGDKSPTGVRASSVVSNRKDEGKVAESKGVPPPRSLPFGRAGTGSGAVTRKPAAPAESEDDESTDDEEL